MLGDDSDLQGSDDQSYWSAPGSSLNGAPRDWTSPQACAGLDPALIHAYGLLDPLDVPKPVPGLLGSSEDIAAIASGRNGPSDPEQSDPAFSMAANAPQRQLGGAPMPYHAVPSPHVGHYATLDEAAKAAASDVPRNADAEYEAFFPERRTTNNIDLGDGYGPQSISLGDGYDYGGLYTSGNTAKVNVLAPLGIGGWFHNHPWDSGVDNEANQRPSPGTAYDEGTINRLHEKNPLIETYILGPDGVLRKFLLPSDKGQIVRRDGSRAQPWSLEDISNAADRNARSRDGIGQRGQ